ncbi:putative MFS-type transporter YcaD [Pseudoruegeria aquimaris]|uniref:Putative MFS-type transporter YcaD n=1 Tax=Pseudoruegeria aquimaris TaxID=393663 RepID=A0A1Y5R9W5_9RHOB|nr:MFS transporter [Pseudoruegeria aquimaris]SLN11376.1 putative MFS-type transporter YcaD [Pseudoruegeria aquimaris]
MLQVLSHSWALLLGMLLLMVGNGLQGTLLGVRGAIEGFSTFEMSIVMSAYFLGFLGGSKLAPQWIRRVGHVRVFAALGSMISAVLILYPTFAHPWAWTLGRVVIGFCFCGVYVTAESWLNNAASNENRGKALSLYMIVQMAGIVTAQALLAFGDPAGFILFIIPSVLVSISFAPILLSISPTPAFETTKPMSLKELYGISPLGCVGMAVLGGVFSAQFGMSAVYGTEAGLSVGQISIFVSAIYIGALLMQFPIGWISDRMDRRTLIMFVSALGGAGAVLGVLSGGNFYVLLVSGFLIGGTSNPLYALLIAYTNDYLEAEDMAAASGGLLFINGLGAIAGPVTTGWVMSTFGPWGYWLILAVLMLGLALYAVYRMTQRPAATDADENVSYAPVLPSASPVAVGVAQEVFIETAQEDENNTSDAGQANG